MTKDVMGPKQLTAGQSGVIRPGACVTILSKEEVTLPQGCCGVIGIRVSLGNRSLTLGATLVPSGYNGHVRIQLINHNLDPQDIVEIKEGDELVNLEYLATYAG